MDLNQVTVPCVDYDASVRFYTTLGLRQIVDSPPRYARFETASGTTFSIHLASQPAEDTGTVIYFEVPDVDSTVDELKGKGINFDTDPKTQDWLWREARLRDPAGNRVCIYAAGENRRFPPWRMESADE